MSSRDKADIIVADQRPLFSRIQTLHVDDEDYRSVRRARVRILMGLFVFAAFLSMLLLRLGQISVFRAIDSPRTMIASGEKIRADLHDRNGELLATTLKTYSLYADARKVWDAEESTKAILSALPELDGALVEERLSSGRPFVWIKRNLTPIERQSVFSLGLPELAFQIEPKRAYPRGRLAGHVIGFTDIDLHGTAGAEKAFDDELSSDGATPKRLSVDMRVQFALEDELRFNYLKFKALAAAGVVLNIKTGEVLGMASMPDFDPNRASEALPEESLNRASMTVYELGSTFKPINMALALESGAAKPGDRMAVQKPLVIQRKSIKDDHPSQAALTLKDILAQSSNRGSAMLALRAGADAQQAFLKELGLFGRVPYELAESALPLLPPEWQPLTIATVSFGHGISVTPLSLAVALSTILNDGMYVEPTIVRRDPGAAVPARRVMSSETAQTVTDMMRYVVTNGTGRNAAVKGYEVMGKTGTAEKIINGTYAKRRLVTSFVAAFPHRDPQYLVYLTFDEPKAIEGTYGYATAGWNAAPTAGAVIERIAPILAVRKTEHAVASLGGRAGGAQ